MVKSIFCCGNSPDLNMIEAIWPKIKRRTTRKGAPQTRSEAERAWIKCWQEFEINRLRAFVESKPWHVAQVSACEGGNDYVEGWRKDLIREFLRLAKVYDNLYGGDD